MHKASLLILAISYACHGRRMHSTIEHLGQSHSRSQVEEALDASEKVTRLLLALNPAGSTNARPVSAHRGLGSYAGMTDRASTLGKSAALLAAFGAAQSASAARSGGRAGGRVSRGGGGGGYRGGGGYGGGYGMSPGIGYGMSPFGFSPFGFSPFGFGFSPFGFGFGVPTPILLFALISIAATTIRSREGGDFGEAEDLPGAALCLQVAVYCSDRADSLYSKINNIASGADTSTEYGLQRLVSDAGLALLRSSKDWVAGRTVSVTKSFLSNDVEEQFNRLQVQERAKFETEKRALKRTMTGGQPTHMVLTLIVLLRDGKALPDITSMTDLRTAIQDLTAEVSVDDNLMGAEVIWTPEEDTDVMDQDDMFLNFPELVSV
eukprot:CAMPEP_0169249212 /NCGR_PEP_ID=MMETSP1016-20121227/36278_1 /TAXON_ID=342587 /ORGANISM="Karlodinium micrum, Strain CCMP2283" /LENGTH=377 /DNA_ID=CAMNT_0009330105 /DNA_START=77 /DNA_END=1210 /DNA_ORIENTATION=+